MVPAPNPPPVTTIVALPATPTLVGAEVVMPTSSGSMRPISVATSSVALTGCLSRSSTCLTPSTTASSTTGTVSVRVVVPGGNVSVPELAV